MKLIFKFIIVLCVWSLNYLAFASIETDDSTEDYLTNEVEDFQFNSFKEEMNFLESKSAPLNNYLDNKASNEAAETSMQDEVSITRSAIQRAPAIDPVEKMENIEVEDLLKTDTPPQKQRRIRSR